MKSFGNKSSNENLRSGFLFFLDNFVVIMW